MLKTPIFTSTTDGDQHNERDLRADFGLDGRLWAGFGVNCGWIGRGMPSRMGCWRIADAGISPWCAAGW
ncbi:hypothetical protein JKG47_08765 [Acidithiobacillus sp. MC6.1]|nr:hypothetical protein [Acidithiobacillus sp. MC6.1]